MQRPIHRDVYVRIVEDATMGSEHKAHSHINRLKAHKVELPKRRLFCMAF